MMLSTLLISLLASMGLALPTIDLNAPTVKNAAVPSLDNQNKIQWCKDSGFRNCQLQRFDVSDCHPVLFPGEVSGVIVPDVDFKSVTIWDSDDCVGHSISLWDSNGNLNNKLFDNRPRSFQMYRVHYERDSHIQAMPPVTERDVPVLPYLHERDTNDVGPVAELSCIQTCKDVYHKRFSNDEDWTGDNCHNFCSYKMQECANIGNLDWPMSAINTRPVYSNNGLASPNGAVILFEDPDCTGVSTVLWKPEEDLTAVGFNDRAKSFMVMPPGVLKPKRGADIGSTQV